MPVTQLMSVVGRTTSGGGGGGGGGGVDPTANMIAVFDSDDPHRGSGGANGWWLGNGNWYAASVFSTSPPAWNTINYADSTSGHTYDFTGSEYMIGPALGNSGVTAAFSINLWFYPTTNNCQLVSEYGDSDPNSGYHYTMLELNSSGNVIARSWPNGIGSYLTSQVAVNLNAWNHIHYFATGAGVQSLNVNNNPYVGGTFSGRSGPATSAFAFGVSDITYINNTNRFQGKIGYFSYQNDANGASMWNSLATRYGL